MHRSALQQEGAADTGYIGGVELQNQIKRTLNQPSALAWIADRLAQGDAPHRTALARQACEHLA